MKVLLDEVDFASCRMLLGESPLVTTTSCGARCGLEGIKLLLQRGASVHDRDRFGNTCLHLWLKDAEQGLATLSAGKSRDALIYVIQQGADVLAKNHLGVSVSDVAFNGIEDSEIFSDRFREELWDCALVNCGYNLAAFKRRRRPRVFSSPCRFTSQHFEDLWADCAHLRPDYDNRKSAIYFSRPAEATECGDEASQWDESRDSDQSGSDEISNDGDPELDESEDCDGSRPDKIDGDDDGDSELEEEEGYCSDCFDFWHHSKRCCPPFVRIRRSAKVHT